MFNNNYEQYSNGSYAQEPRWDEFTLDDEKRARSRFSRFSFALFIYMLLASVIMLAAQLIIEFTMGERAEQILGSEWFLWVANVVSMYVIAFPVLYLIIFKMRKTVRSRAKLSFKEFIKLLCISSALMYIGNMVANTLSSIIELFKGSPVPDHTSELIENSSIWAITAVAVIIGPIVEELIFRKLLMDRLGVYGDRIAIVFSAITFALFHGNIYQLFYAGLLGLLLGYVYSRTGNILYPIAIHMVINFFGSVIPMLLMDKINRFNELYEAFISGAEYNEQEFFSTYAIVGIYSFLTLAVVVAGVVIFIKNYKRIFVSDRCEVLIPKAKRLPIIAGNAGMIIFTVFMLINMILNMFI